LFLSNLLVSGVPPEADSGVSKQMLEDRQCHSSSGSFHLSSVVRLRLDWARRRLPSDTWHL